MWEWLKNLFADGDEVRSARELAERGENMAARYLRDKKYKILIRNFRTDFGEIDIVARHGKTLVFVEVKTRESDAISAPERQVDEEKQAQVVKMARLYLSQYGVPKPEYRFDIVAIVWPRDGEPRINHLPGAFGG